MANGIDWVGIVGKSYMPLSLSLSDATTTIIDYQSAMILLPDTHKNNLSKSMMSAD